MAKKRGGGKKSKFDSSSGRTPRSDSVMAKKRRGGKKRKFNSSSDLTPRIDAEIEFLSGGVEAADDLPSITMGESALQTPEGKASMSPSQPKVLASLSNSELSATYGKGFELLQRMGFADSTHGLRSDSLSAPLQVHNRGKSRMGVHGESEQFPCIVAENKAPDSERPMSDLLKDVLETMQQAGDFEEASELKKLAACVGSEELGAMPDCSILSKSSTSVQKLSGKAEATGFNPAADAEAMSMLMKMFQDADFPVDLLGQSKTLHWRKRWQCELGSYETFIERHDRSFQLIRCPAPYGPLVFPRTGSQSSPWIQDKRYAKWCHDCRLAASGKAKRKWRHVELMISRLCRQKLSTDSDSDESNPIAEVSCDSSPLDKDHAQAVHDQTQHSKTSLREANLESDASVEALEWCEDVEGCSS